MSHFFQNNGGNPASEPATVPNANGGQRNDGHRENISRAAGRGRQVNGREATPRGGRGDARNATAGRGGRGNGISGQSAEASTNAATGREERAGRGPGRGRNNSGGAETSGRGRSQWQKKQSGDNTTRHSINSGGAVISTASHQPLCPRGAGCIDHRCGLNHIEVPPQRCAVAPPKKQVICTLCGLKFHNSSEALFCCYGKSKVRQAKAPTNDLKSYLLNARSKWKCCSQETVCKILSVPSTSEALKCSEITDAAESGILYLLRTIQQQDISSVRIKGFSTFPWNVRASNLTGAGSLLECFTTSTEIMGAPIPGSKSAIGMVIHSLLDTACENNWIGNRWKPASSRFTIFDKESSNIPVFGNCDAVFDGFPVEIKTVDNINARLGPIQSWLGQIAVYQLLYPDVPSTILVVISRDTNEIKAFEVNRGNIENAVTHVRSFIAQEPEFYADCLDIARGYTQNCMNAKASGLPLSAANPNRLFIDILPRIYDLFQRHASIFLEKTIHDVRNNDLSLAAIHLIWFRRCFKILNQARQIPIGLTPAFDRLKLQCLDAANAAIAEGTFIITGAVPKEQLRQQIHNVITATNLLEGVHSQQHPDVLAARANIRHMRSLLHADSLQSGSNKGVVADTDGEEPTEDSSIAVTMTDIEDSLRNITIEEQENNDEIS